MPTFNPNLPLDHSDAKSAEMRNQFTSLKALIDAQALSLASLTARVSALENKRRGLIFNGLDNYAVNPAVAWPAAGTWELWIKVTGTISDLWPGVAGDGSGGGLPGTNYDTTGLPFFEFIGAGHLNGAVFGNGADYFNEADWSQWHHLALTWDPAGSPKVQLFMDGVPVASLDTMNVPVTSSAPMQIGYPTRTNAGLQMAMSEVRLSGVVRYNASFTPATTFAPDADTVALYKFTEQTGVTVGDSSGNGNDMMLTTLPGGTLPVWWEE